ncbi:ArsR/SmtB family transcription factor [Clostridium lacusfryxellense]|uniref:ArsR/SmtB family transcription factor n=1 Tax=Clostridium lacusfryxellense TaxID=205328 RepID=UPI001C0DE8C4|nr:metalloregulator ArsR/SmtB family transcription factor [Clostridium lacusfryxellense]MBU3111096.1 metalloregulator ArsR/SmtB family transcription factor [Clostridium lacusfryxellense]
MEKLTNLFKVLSDETRLRILVLLYHKKLCVCQIQGILEEPQPKISKHLGKLRDMGFVKDERQEQFIYYYIDNDNTLLKEILEKIIFNSENHLTLQRDLENLQKGDEYAEMFKKKCNPNS